MSVTTKFLNQIAMLTTRVVGHAGFTADKLFNLASARFVLQYCGVQMLREHGYVDAVKLAGHSCPTVAGAYLRLDLVYKPPPPKLSEVPVFAAVTRSS